MGALRFLLGYAAPYSSSYDTLSQHRYVEACRHVFAIRMSLSDPKFDPDANANAVKDLIGFGSAGPARDLAQHRFLARCDRACGGVVRFVVPRARGVAPRVAAAFRRLPLVGSRRYGPAFAARPSVALAGARLAVRAGVAGLRGRGPGIPPSRLIRPETREEN